MPWDERIYCIDDFQPWGPDYWIIGGRVRRYTPHEQNGWSGGVDAAAYRTVAMTTKALRAPCQRGGLREAS
jgi:hypothetical protein